jgi:hypothetical protein
MDPTLLAGSNPPRGSSIPVGSKAKTALPAPRWAGPPRRTLPLRSVQGSYVALELLVNEAAHYLLTNGLQHAAPGRRHSTKREPLG